MPAEPHGDAGPGEAPRVRSAAVYGLRRACPIAWCTAPPDRVLFILAHLHEVHAWTRAELMTWVDRVERGEA